MNRPPDLFDIVVIGGGVNGCGIARDAAGRGAKVLLLEADDLAGGTSSASTKLIHGGLRYLEFYEFGLVRESLSERERLWAMAPHIVWPLRFVLPHVPGVRPRWLGGRRRLPASDREWARNADDVLWRRTKLGLRFYGSEVIELEQFIQQERLE